MLFAAAIREGWTGDADNRKPAGWRRVQEKLMDLAFVSMREQFVPPLTAWRRPIGQTSVAGPPITLEDESTPFWPRS
jgi:hypothetical protein